MEVIPLTRVCTNQDSISMMIWNVYKSEFYLNTYGGFGVLYKI